MFFQESEIYYFVERVNDFEFLSPVHELGFQRNSLVLRSSMPGAQVLHQKYYEEILLESEVFVAHFLRTETLPSERLLLAASDELVLFRVDRSLGRFLTDRETDGRASGLSIAGRMKLSTIGIGEVVQRNPSLKRR